MGLGNSTFIKALGTWTLFPPYQWFRLYYVRGLKDEKQLSIAFRNTIIRLTIMPIRRTNNA